MVLGASTYSAVIVVVPLIYPMAEAYGIDPTWASSFWPIWSWVIWCLLWGRISVLSSYRFNQALTHVYRSTLPFVVILMVAVLLITYFPPMTLGLVEIFFER